MAIIDGNEYTLSQLFDFIDEDVSNAVSYIYNFINHLTLDVSNDIFSDVIKIENYVVDSYPTEPLRTSLRGRKGIYVFVVERDMDLTRDEVVSYSHRCTGSGFPHWVEISLRVGQHFYQGSATGMSLLSRLNQHYSNRNDISSMRLNSNERLFIKDNLSVYVFPVKRELQDNSFIIRMIEKELHNQFPAITGSNRV